MRTWQWWLVGLTAFSLACGGTDEVPAGDEGHGGTVGSGGGPAGPGSGGAGTGGAGGDPSGAGGMGGEGGGVAPGHCGDGHLDEGEACDDGNFRSGDGCSATCTLEGSCDTPIDWMLVSSDGQLGQSFTGTIHAPAATEEGSCGAAGGEVIYRVVAPDDGLFSLSHSSDVASVDWVRSSCDDAATELFCWPTALAGRTEVTEGQELFFAIDLPEGVSQAEVTIVADMFPWRQEGENCHTGASGQCAEGLTCDDISVFQRCVVNHPPVLDEVLVLRSGDDLSLVVSGSDANGNANKAIDVRFFDASGTALLVTDTDKDGTLDDDVLVVIADLNPGHSVVISETAWVEGFFADHPEAVRAEVAMRDSEVARSDWVPADILPLPAVGLGETCDLRSRADRCPVDAVCHPDTSDVPVCQTLESVRQQRCAAAPLIEPGMEITGQVDRTAIGGQGHWDPPAACIAREHSGSGAGAPEGLARLHLDQDMQNLIVSTDIIGSMDSVLYVLEGCGTDPLPLACNDDVDDRNRRSHLHLDHLEAGAYLIVVDMRESQRISANWTLRVDLE